MEIHKTFTVEISATSAWQKIPRGEGERRGGSLIEREKLQVPTGEIIKHQQVKAMNQQTHLLTVCFLQPITMCADREHWGVDGCSGNVFYKFVQVWWLFAPVRETATQHNRGEDSNISSSSSNYNHGDDNVAVLCAALIQTDCPWPSHEDTCPASWLGLGPCRHYFMVWIWICNSWATSCQTRKLLVSNKQC